jgi:hypothetical protein
MSDEPELSFFGDDPSLILKILGYAHPDSAYDWDRQWLNANLKVDVGSFTGDITRDIQTKELNDFCDQLQKFYRTLSGEAVLNTLEHWLMIKLEADKLGGIHITGFVQDGVYDENRLHFTLYTDQTYLPSVISQLKNILARFPTPPES